MEIQINYIVYLHYLLTWKMAIIRMTAIYFDLERKSNGNSADASSYVKNMPSSCMLTAYNVNRRAKGLMVGDIISILILYETMYHIEVKMVT
jgi:hypothetical protein